MAEITQSSPLPPASSGAAGRSQSASTPVKNADLQQKRNNRSKKQKTPYIPQQDGTVSDSVNVAVVSPRTKRPQRNGPVLQNGTPQPNGNTGNVALARPRPVSLGGPMLPATPAKEQAYAGPTFHNSPAPSTLPMPKFFSRSVPKNGNPLQTRLDDEVTPDKEASSPEADVVSPVPPPRETMQSPLDLFFQADKQERQQRASTGGMLSPEMTSRRPVPSTEPRNLFQQRGKSIFLHELDGQNEETPSPRTAPPKQKPPPIGRTQSSPGVQAQSDDHEHRQAATRSLKDILFNTAQGNPNQSATPPQQQQRPTQSVPLGFKTPSPFNTRMSGPSTPAQSIDQANQYALHYGNRNLSPLFQAARHDSPLRPSGLRQAFPGTNSAESSVTSPSQPPPPQPRTFSQNDPNAFMRGFLNQQAQGAAPSNLPHLPYGNGNGNAAYPAYQQQNYSAPHAPEPRRQDQQPQQVSRVNGSVDGAASSATTNGRYRSMEDDLKRMLNLNVL
ncbi:hypothetical protein LTR62_006973 [Meristemomyces frigidus]|uniref:Proteophosphoglycan 5 n=1 Tax=Meristemomyces frigidus TaxID=1508187 RepID=A0AAN7YPD6_9PEZI|nr:hypothetical protein LTR62_006973 [Meristemomyces frigidus]